LSAARRSTDYDQLERSLGYVFSDKSVLALALTHVGATQNRLESYQRLEFLGDRVLGLAVAAMLQATFPDAEEGELSRRLSELVRRESCAEVAARWTIAPFIRLGAGEARNEALKRAIAPDICEAIIGAVFLDGGYEAAAAVVRLAFEAQMHTPVRPLRGPKTRLQEWAHAKGLREPIYKERERAGPDHAPEFTIAVVVEGYPEVAAKGSSKRLAEQAAATAFIEQETAGEEVP
jgi:ribonuclease III